VLKSCRWEETAHPFFLESLLRPLAQGARVCQVAVAWTSRKEGKTNNSFLQNFKYIRTVLNVYGAKNAGIAEPAISSIGRRRSSI